MSRPILRRNAWHDSRKRGMTTGTLRTRTNKKGNVPLPAYIPISDSFYIFLTKTGVTD